MLEEQEAIERILATTAAPEPERVDLANAVGRFLLRDVIATESLPGFDQSAMDGYAFASSSASAAGDSLQVIGEQPAGPDLKLRAGAGEAIRIFTGAPLPLGTDTVVMQEDVQREGDCIRLQEAVAANEFVRRQGEIICRGQRIAGAGDRLSAGGIALLASQGMEAIEVGRRPRVAVVATGDELVPPGAGPLQPGQIYNSNSAMLAAAVNAAGIGAVTVAHAPDDLDVTAAVLQSSLESADVVLVAGGVSVGERDQVRPALLRCGLEIDFWRVCIKPGKPLVYARDSAGRQFFGLPGNPVSALVTFTIFARPALLARMGAVGAGRHLPVVQVPLAEAVTNSGDRPHYMRGAITADGQFCPGNQQVAHGLLAMAGANALLRVEAGGEFAKGQNVEVGMLD